jgi:hypothetical protein
VGASAGLFGLHHDTLAVSAHCSTSTPASSDRRSAPKNPEDEDAATVEVASTRRLLQNI